MFAYIVRRLVVLPVILWVLSLLIFSLTMLLTPTERLASYITSPEQLKGGTQQINRLISRYHLNEPWYIQYSEWFTNFLHGNMGWSVSAEMPVLKALERFLPATAELALFAIFPVLFGGIGLGTISAVHHNQPLDHAIRFFAIAGWSLPTFIAGLIGLMIFFAFLGWFPPGRLSVWAIRIVQSSGFHRYTGMNTIDAILNGNWRILLDALRHLVLPSITLSYVLWASLLRIMRSSMLEALRQDYVTTARAKGLPEKIVIKRHARRNAMLPVTTVAGLMVAGLLSGTVVVETVFDYHGVGLFAVGAAQQLDFPGVLGFALFAGALLVFGNLVVDILYTYLDPRVRLW